jgi:hypothetical protein
MSGLFQITIQEAQGLTAISADIDRLAVVMGCSSAGSGLSQFFLSGSSAIADRGYGDAVDTLTQIIEQRLGDGGAGIKFPAAMYTVPGTTTGSYGAIDVTGVVGTGAAAVDSSVHPYGTHEARVLWVNPVTALGTAGGTYKTSRDGGRTYSRTTALGTATSITIPNSNIKFNLGTVLKGTTDVSAGALYGVAATLDGLTLILNVNGGGSTTLTLNGATNTANEAAFLAAIHSTWAALVATDSGAGSGHKLVLTNVPGSTITVGAGTANTALGLTPGTYAGTFLAGDLIKVRTKAPAPAVADVDAAFVALAASTVDCGLVVLDCDCDAAMAAHVTTGLNVLAAAGKDWTAVVRTRIRDFEAAESETTWGTLIEADFATFNDDRISVRAAYNLQTDAVTTEQFLRSTLAQYAADLVRVGRFGWPAAPADRAEPNVTMILNAANEGVAAGTTIGHDEGPRGVFTGLSNETLGNRFSAEQRLADPTRREDVFNTVPWVMFPAGSRIRNIMTRRLANAMKRVAKAAAIPKLGTQLFYVATTPGNGTLTQTSRLAIQGAIYQALKGEFANEIDNADDASVDSGLVQIDSAITVTGGNLLGITGTLAPRVAGFTLSIGLTLAIQE